MIRAMSYTPNGLFNHTAAIYQMMTGYTTDKVSPSGQLEPPSPKDFPNFGSNIIRLKPPTEPMLPFVMLPRPSPGVQRRRQGGERPASSVRRSTPTRCTPTATTWIMAKMEQDQDRRPSATSPKSSPCGSNVGRSSATPSTPACPIMDKAVADQNLNEYYQRALSLVDLGPRSRRFQHLSREPESRSATCTAATRSARAACSPAVWSRRGPVWSRWSGPRSPTRTTTRGTTTVGLTEPDEETSSGPMLDAGLSGLHLRPRPARDAQARPWSSPSASSAGARKKGVSTSGNGNSADGRDHWPYCYTAVDRRGRDQAGATSTASPTRPARRRLTSPVHPGELLATIYHAFGIDPATIVYNHLKQPRELVKAEAVGRLFA